MKISIIIPVLNEASNIESAIEKAWLAGADQVIVADGGSADQTFELAEQSNCQTCVSPPGRGQQMNAGAKIATGDVLLFLHADNWLAENAIEKIRELKLETERFWGCFLQRIEHEHPVYRWLESGNALRAKWQQLVYGDQAMFISRVLFETVGQFPNQPLMEDFEISRRLSLQARPIILPGPVYVSARRWQKNGVAGQTLKNWSLAFAYRLGRSPEKLRQRYQA